MSSPILFPSSLPRPLADGHVFEPVDACVTQELDLGEVRRLPIYSTQPMFVAASWRVTQAQYDVWRDFVEGMLTAAALDFDVQLALQGSSALSWYTVALVEHDAEALAGGRWLVTARLFVREELGVTRPPFVLGGAGTVTLAGMGVPTLAPGALHGGGDITLYGAAIRMVRGAGDITLGWDVTHTRVTTAGDTRVTTGGDVRVTRG